MSGPDTQPDADNTGHGQRQTGSARRRGLDFRVAHTHDEVVSAWQLVYTAYRRKELIEPNPFRLHTVAHAIHPKAAVVLGMIDELIVSTLTVMGDTDGGGLPLDRVYHDELAALRGSGRRLMEVGLFADRRDKLARTAEAMLEMMRFTFYYGRHYHIDDIMIGVHPRHSRFYIRTFGFEPIGAERDYPAVNNHPVIMLRGDIQANLDRVPPHPSLEYYLENPVELEALEKRFPFFPQQLAGSPLVHFQSEDQAHQS